MKIKSVGVVGGGSAGFLTALALKKELPHLEVEVVKSSKIPIIGVGESTTWRVPDFLHNFVGLDRGEFYRAVEPSWKGSVRLYWGKRPHFDYVFEIQMGWRTHHPVVKRNAAFYCTKDFRTPSIVRECIQTDHSPLITLESGQRILAGPVGYHIENEKFVAHLEKTALSLGVRVLDREVTGFPLDAKGNLKALVFEEGGRASYDLYVDSTGFRSRILGETMQVPFVDFKRSLWCDRAVVGGYPRPTGNVRPYTGCVSMKAGWTFVIDHWDRVNTGYVYSSRFISDDAAEREYRALMKRLGGKVDKTRIVHFRSGRYERAWQGNVIGVGNAAGFVEPLQATALHVICDAARTLCGVLVDGACAPTEAHVRHYNRVHESQWDEIRRFIAMHYKLNDRYKTPFWRGVNAEVDLAGAEEILECYRTGGPSSLFSQTARNVGGIFGYDGFLVVMVGMNAKTSAKWTVSRAERAAWKEILAQHLAPAARALPMREAWATVRAPTWDWDSFDAQQMRAYW